MKGLSRTYFPIGVILLAILCILFSVAQHGAFPDDIYITWRCARNFAQGYGLSYNHGENYLGTSAPGYALLLGIFGKILGAEGIPLTSEILSTLAIFLTGIGLWVGFRRSGQELLGFVAAILYSVLPFVRNAYGFEVLLQIACVVWAYVLCHASEDQTSSKMPSVALLALGTFLRPDGFLWALPAFVFVWASSTHLQNQTSSHRVRLAFLKAFPLRETALFVGLLFLALLMTRLASGQWMPSTFAAKSAQRASTDWPGFLDGGMKWLETVLARQNPLLPTVMWIAVLGFACSSYTIVGQRNRLLGLLLTGIALHFAVYTNRLPFYGWYFAPEGLGVALLAALAISATYRVLNRLVPYLGVIFGALALYFGFMFSSYSLSVTRADQLGLAGSEKVRTYTAFGNWLRANTDPSDTVGLCEVGIIGWVSDRPIIDQFFLVSRGDLDSISRHIYDKSFKERKPTYIAESPMLFGTMRGHSWFWRDYEFLTSFPSNNSQPITPIEADQFRTSGHLEMDIWRRRTAPLPMDQAVALAKAYIGETDSYKKGKS